jgi:hypothetical protein
MDAPHLQQPAAVSGARHVAEPLTLPCAMARHTVPLARIAFRAAAPLARLAVVAWLPVRLGLLAGGSMFAVGRGSYPFVGDGSLQVPRHLAHVLNVGHPSWVRSFGIVPQPPHRPHASSPWYGSSRQPYRATVSGVRSSGGSGGFWAGRISPTGFSKPTRARRGRRPARPTRLPAGGQRSRHSSHARTIRQQRARNTTSSTSTAL